MDIIGVHKWQIILQIKPPNLQTSTEPFKLPNYLSFLGKIPNAPLRQTALESFSIELLKKKKFTKKILLLSLSLSNTEREIYLNQVIKSLN